MTSKEDMYLLRDDALASIALLEQDGIIWHEEDIVECVNRLRRVILFACRTGQIRIWSNAEVERGKPW